MKADADIVYRINSLDELTYVNPAWVDFALANDAPELSADRVLGRRLWDFIEDQTTASLYREIVDQAHAGRRMTFQFRCDAPGVRRRMEMTVTKSGAGEIEFTSLTAGIAERPAADLLNRRIPRIGNLLRLCGWCKRVDVGAGIWSEIEEAAEAFSLFERDSLPPITHGMCEQCFQDITSRVRK